MIHNLLKDNKAIRNKAVQIDKLYNTADKQVGNKITFMLSGTLYFGENMISEEFLVYEHTFKPLCMKYSMFPIEYKSFESLYNDSYQLNEESKHASFVNCAFVFQKREN